MAVFILIQSRIAKRPYKAGRTGLVHVPDQLFDWPLDLIGSVEHPSFGGPSQLGSQIYTTPIVPRNATAPPNLQCGTISEPIMAGLSAKMFTVDGFPDIAFNLRFDAVNRRRMCANGFRQKPAKLFSVLDSRLLCRPGVQAEPSGSRRSPTAPWTAESVQRAC